jgi:hypothetical protein
LRVLALLIAAGVCAGATGFPGPAPREASLADLLERAGKFVIDYERDISAIVADEDYIQTETDDSRSSMQVRRLRSDFLTVRDAAGDWIGFRDVYDVDGKPVRDRTDRLAKLFLEDKAGQGGQAARIADESARFNLIPAVSRTINLPLLALTFLRPSVQNHSEFKMAGSRTVDGKTVSVVTFQEHAKPRVIRTDDDAAANGRFWIEAESGRIRASELSVNSRKGRFWVMAVIEVSYGAEPRLNAWVPLKMSETYRGSAGVIRGRALYSGFRKFGVTTGEIVKAP